METYDQLMISQSVLCIFSGALMYVFFRNKELRLTIFFSLTIELALCLTFYAVLADKFEKEKEIISFLTVIHKGIVQAFGIVPVLIAMTPLIPESVEASLAALIYGLMAFAYEWGGKMVTSATFSIMGIEYNEIDKISDAVLIKAFILFLMIIFTCYLPS